MIDPHFAILGALITLTGSVAYARDTVRGRTQPNRVTWSLWALAPMIAFAAELAQHVGLDALLTFAVGFGPLIVVIASFMDPRAYARLTGFDILCGVLSLAALVGWAVTRSGNVAILLSLLADSLGAIPTFRKALRDPASESANAFIGSAVGAAITLLTIPAARWGFASCAFPAYILVADSTLTGLILIPRRPRARQPIGEVPTQSGDLTPR
ncbi:MAG: hypothetical protein WBQ18_01580 [Solirubrobacteraceae bacterium]